MNTTIRSIFLCIFLAYGVQVNAMDANFRGSADEVKEQLYSIFPIGTDKADVISIASCKLELDETNLDVQDYGEVPLVTKVDGETLRVSSWLKMKVAEYRSIKHLFIETSVVATFLFDNNEKLIAIDVQVSGDSL